MNNASLGRDRGRTMRYRVEAYRSLTLCRVFDVMEFRHEPMYWGPWKTLKTAKKKAAELRKSRCRTVESDGVLKDHGPDFVKVRILTDEQAGEQK